MEHASSEPMSMAEAYELAAERMGNGWRTEQIIAELRQSGVTQDNAEYVLHQLSLMRAQERFTEGKRMLLSGLAVFVGFLLLSIALTALLSAISSQINCVSFIAYGGILYGPVQAIRGVFRMLNGMQELARLRLFTPGSKAKNDDADAADLADIS